MRLPFSLEVCDIRGVREGDDVVTSPHIVECSLEHPHVTTYTMDELSPATPAPCMPRPRAREQRPRRPMGDRSDIVDAVGRWRA